MKLKIKSVQELMDEGFYFNEFGELVDNDDRDIGYVVVPELLHTLGKVVRDTKLCEFYWTEIVEKPLNLYFLDGKDDIQIAAEDSKEFGAYVLTTEHGFSLTIEQTKEMIQKLEEIIKYKEFQNENQTEGKQQFI